MDDIIKQGRGNCYQCEISIMYSDRQVRPKFVGGDDLIWCKSCYRKMFIRNKKLIKRKKA